jgi:glycosyltransferase involved in cell wall biosynthesis
MIKSPLFSLVCATLGRTEPLARLFETLAQQTYRNFELILVDQNDDDRLTPLVVEYLPRFTIRHIKTVKGLSRARNTGLDLAEGDIISFPDDDCWFSADLLEKVVLFFAQHQAIDLLTGAGVDEKGEPVGRWDSQPGPLGRRNIWTRGIGFAIFLRGEAAKRVGGFDITLGVGSGTAFPCCEDTEFLIRAVDAGLRSHYDPNLLVYHPNKKYTEAGLARAFNYGAGMGCVLRRQHFDATQLGKYLMRPLAGAALFLLTGRITQSRYQLTTFRGRLWGYVHGSRSP